ncbi:MAG: hypothetical protein J5715_02365, partial [Clostridiales bacterium]|nr:hypothetical protein [Clostridiales bacterium]
MKHNVSLKIVSSVITMAVTLTALPFIVSAGQVSIDYREYSLNSEDHTIYSWGKTAYEYTRLSSVDDEDGVTLTDGFYFVGNDNDVTFNNRITVSGDVKLILSGKKLYANKGIYVSSGSTLNIYGGNYSYLVAKGESGNAGIGGNRNAMAGTINIKGGDIEVYGGEDAAGIGGGGGKDSGYKSIFIYEGIIKSYGGDGGAGVGSGEDNDVNKIGDININSQDLDAYAGEDAAAIGGGNECAAETINIYGGNILADACYKNHDNGAGIGGGDNGEGGVVTIYGGTVRAEGSLDGAGIGGGDNGDGGWLYVYGGSLYVSSCGGGAGIGGGNGGDGGFVYIYGGSTLASCGRQDDSGAGIGGGNKGNGGEVYISGGYVKALGGGEGAGIGGGCDKDGHIVEISGGTVIALGGTGGGAGIGGGWAGNGYNNANSRIIISGGNVEATGQGGGAGIGGGKESFWTSDGGKGGPVEIKGGTVYAFGDYDARPIGSGSDDGTNGPLGIDDGLKVSSGVYNDETVTVQKYADRVGACQNKKNQWVRVEPCNTHDAVYEEKDLDNHNITCTICGYKGVEKHELVNDKCSKCNAVRYTEIFDPDNGKDEPVVTLHDTENYTVHMMDKPDAPKGKIFYKWVKSDEPSVSFDAGNEITYDATGSVTFKAVWYNGLTVTYDPNNGIDRPYQVLVKPYLDDHGNPTGGATFSLDRAPEHHQEGQEFTGWKVEGIDDLQDPNATVSVSGDVTVTAHWQGNPIVTFLACDSDGVRDDFDPVVINNFPSDTKIGDLFIANKDAIRSQLVLPDGYSFNDTYMVIPEPINSYSAMEYVPTMATNDWWYNTGIGTGNLTVYIPIFRLLNNIDLTIDLPVCGEESWTGRSGKYFDYSTQTNCPKIRIAEDSGFNVSEEGFEGIWNLYDLESTTEGPYTLRFIGDESYIVSLGLDPKIGCAIDGDNDDSSNVTVTVNGETAVETARRVSPMGISLDILVKAEHDMSDWAEDTPGTCCAKSVEKRSCTGCEFSETREGTLDPDNHDWGDPVVEEATCTNLGRIIRTCKNDPAHIDLETTEALGHVFDSVEYSWAEDKSTCTATARCSRCNEEVTETEPAKIIESIESTCEEGGKITYEVVFKTEGFAEQTDTVDLDLLEHNWDEGEVTREATCTEAGEKTFTCTDCGATKTEEIPVKEHTPLAVDEVSATCIATGTTAGHICSVCKAILDGCEEIPVDPDAHKPVDVEETPTTCTDEGCTAGTKCELCGNVLTGCETIDPLGHDYVDVEGTEQAATCTEAGKEADKVCSRCGDRITGAVIDAKGHNWDTTIRKASFTEPGSVTKICSVCGAEETEVIAQVTKVSLGAASYTYTGEAIEPEVTVAS